MFNGKIRIPTLCFFVQKWVTDGEWKGKFSWISLSINKDFLLRNFKSKFFLFRIFTFLFKSKWLMVRGPKFSWISLPTSEVTSVVLFTKLYLLHTDVTVLENRCLNKSMSCDVTKKLNNNNKNNTSLRQYFDGKKTTIKFTFQSCLQSKIGLLLI